MAINAKPWDFIRTHDVSGASSRRKVAAIAQSMRTSGWKGSPIAVLEHNGQKYILDGHHRTLAARQSETVVAYRAVSPRELPHFGYHSIDEVLQAAAEAGPVRLR
jgi:hypothetical protein